MVISGDYLFTWSNFLGVNISVIGSILYTYVTFRTKERSQSPCLITVQPVEKVALLS
jgi:solute carrier family 35 protein